MQKLNVAWRHVNKAADAAYPCYLKAKGEATRVGSTAIEGIKENPKAAIMPLAVAGGALTGGLLMGPVLGVIGFSSVGPVAGSIAAGVQSAGAAGAVFSTLQSAAMGGYGVAAVVTSFVGAGAVAGAAAGAAANATLDNPSMQHGNPVQDSEEEEDGEDEQKEE